MHFEQAWFRVIISKTIHTKFYNVFNKRELDRYVGYIQNRLWCVENR